METALRLFLIAWFITSFEPITKHIKALYGRFYNSWLRVGFDILSCFKCLSFWLVLIGTFDPLYALGASFIATIYTDVVER